jgi:hypothetical protein
LNVKINGLRSIGGLLGCFLLSSSIYADDHFKQQQNILSEDSNYPCWLTKMVADKRILKEMFLFHIPHGLTDSQAETLLLKHSHQAIKDNAEAIFDIAKQCDRY